MLEFVITSSVLIALVFAVKFTLKRVLSHRLQYAMWLLVALRLMLPVIPASGVSVMNFINTAPAESYIIGADVIISTPEHSALPEAPAVKKKQLTAPAQYFLYIWLSGGSAVGAWFIAVNTSFAMHLRKHRKQALTLQGCKLPIHKVKGLSSPCLFGILKPRIYISDNARLSNSELAHIVAHELSHYKQLDHIWAALRTVLLAVHWYNPLVWAAAIASREDCELACDELAIKCLGEESRIIYGETLLKLMQGKRRRDAFFLGATTMSYSKNGIKRRICALARAQRPFLWATLLAATAVAFVAGCTFTGSALTASEAAENIISGLTKDDNSIYFTIPQGYTGNDYNILIYGKASIGEQSMSVHLLQELNEQSNWQRGKTYELDMSSTKYSELNMEIYMNSDKNVKQSVNLLYFFSGDKPTDANSGASLIETVYNNHQIEFPAYQDGRNEFNYMIYDCPPFLLNAAFPASWEIKKPNSIEEISNNFVTSAFNTPYEIYDGDKLIGILGFEIFEPNFDNDISPQGYYLTVFPSLRLGIMYVELCRHAC